MSTNHTSPSATNEFVLAVMKMMDFHFPVLPWYEYVINSILSVVCVFFAGLMSGLTLGLLSYDRMTLEILIASGTKAEKWKAKLIRQLTRHHHWLLVTLLISNAIAMEALPIFLDAMVPWLFAVLLSVSFILTFGEIIPQALCSRYALIIGSYSYPLVAFLMVVTFPASYPLGKLLDCLLGGSHFTFFRRAQLAELVSIHANDPEKSTALAGPLSGDEINVIRGALALSEKCVSDPSIMTPIGEVYMLEWESVLDRDKIQEILKMGHSRIPVFRTAEPPEGVPPTPMSISHGNSRLDLKGVLMVKELIKYIGWDLSRDEIVVKDLSLRKIPVVREDFDVWDLLNIFQEGKSHMAMVYRLIDDRGFFESPEAIRQVEYVGIVTLEEVIEEILQEEILDEKDKVPNSQSASLESHVLAADVYRQMKLSRINQQQKVVRSRGNPRHNPTVLQVEVGKLRRVKSGGNLSMLSDEDDEIRTFIRKKHAFQKNHHLGKYALKGNKGKGKRIGGFKKSKSKNENVNEMELKEKDKITVTEKTELLKKDVEST